MELLKKLYRTYSPTGNEWSLICVIRDYIAMNIPDAKVDMDSWGNLYITKGESELPSDFPAQADAACPTADCQTAKPDGGYPTLVCHMDQVQKLHSPDFEVREENGVLYGWSESNQRREGLGADDKNGVWVCLRTLERVDRLKVFMSVGEEKGCWGSNRAKMEFFRDSLYLLEPDCKGGEEIRTLLRGVPCASPEFEAALEPQRHGYVIAEGKTTDILPLTLSGVGVSAANIPCGYQLPHKDEETCTLADLLRCLEFAVHTCSTLRRRFPHSFQTETQKRIKELGIRN